MWIDDSLCSTGDPVKDLHHALLRHSGGAVWIVLGMMAVHHGARWIKNTAFASLPKDPVTMAAEKGAKSGFSAVKDRSAAYGEAVVAGARGLKKQSTGDDTLSPAAEAELRKAGEAMSSDAVAFGADGKATINIKASELLGIAKVLKNELRVSKSLTDELSDEEIEKLGLAHVTGTGGFHWNIDMDLDTSVLKKTLAHADSAEAGTAGKFGAISAEVAGGSTTDDVVASAPRTMTSDIDVVKPSLLTALKAVTTSVGAKAKSRAV
jgi:hypothetical protein